MLIPTVDSVLDQTSATQLVNRVLQHAQDTGASDVHLIPVTDGLEVLMRCDGRLKKIGVVPPGLVATVVGRFKVLANLLVYRNDVPQEGRIPSGSTGIASEVRIACYPTLLGEKIAVRLDARTGASQDLDDLGFTLRTRAALLDALEQPEGVILLTGPSGSGKTTTLYACLDYITQQEERRNIVTVEDPVERRIDGVVQTEVNESAGISYNVALRSILRQDPEVILIGEVRDRATASMVMEAGLTGHLIASTVHAGTAPQVFARLMELGIEPFAMTSVIRGVLSQRLLRRTCQECEGEANDCTVCDGAGYQGRILVAEWVPMSRPLRQAILTRGDCDRLTAAAMETGYRTLRDEAMALVEAGQTTPQEVNRVLGRQSPFVDEDVVLRPLKRDDVPLVAAAESPREDQADGGGGSGVDAPDPGGDVPDARADAEGTSPFIPRPEPRTASCGDGEDGGGVGGGSEPGGELREPSAEPAAPVSGADSDRDR